nr:MAG TPA: hypothetical protein [Caudoviricetes sp.]
MTFSSRKWCLSFGLIASTSRDPLVSLSASAYVYLFVLIIGDPILKT